MRDNLDDMVFNHHKDEQKDRFENRQEEKPLFLGASAELLQGTGIRPVYSSPRDIYDGDAMSFVDTENGDDIERGIDMMRSLRIIKHEEGNLECEHCK